MADALSYKADPRLGLGSSPNIPVTSNEDFDVLNNTADRIMARSATRNFGIYQQKIKERDALYNALNSGDIKVGEILEQDKPRIKKVIEDLDKAHFRRIQNGMNDLDSLSEYNKALSNANLDVTKAQARLIHFKNENAAMVKDTLPRKQAARKSYLEKVLSNFDNEIEPYVPSFDANLKTIQAYAKPITTEIVDPNRPLFKGKRTSYSPDAMVAEAKIDFAENKEPREDQNFLFSYYMTLPPQEAAYELSIIDKRLDDFNKENGLKEGDKGYQKLMYAKNPDGSIMLDESGRPLIQESIPSFAAKWSLAQQPKFVSETFDFDKDLGSFELGKERNRISAANAAANMKRANAYAALQAKKLSQLNDEEKKVKNFWGGITGKVKHSFFNKGKDDEVSGDFVFSGDLPPGYKLIGGIGSDGKPIELTPKTKDGISYYETIYYDKSGNEINLVDQWKEYRKQGGKGSYNDLRNDLLKRGAVDMELVGDNGRGNFETAYQAARALSNKGTTKDEEPIFSEENEE